MAAFVDDIPEIFNNLSSKITQLRYGRTEDDRKLINKTLDELRTLNYKQSIVTNPTVINNILNLNLTFKRHLDSNKI